jgi:antitoxin (DNA-binding transcriptional repressor) of toxin-antitoxin stability system
MPATISLKDAERQLPQLYERAVSGEEIIIEAEGDKPQVRLVRVERPVQKRQLGGWEGQVWVSDDFDAPLPPDILNGFSGGKS